MFRFNKTYRFFDTDEQPSGKVENNNDSAIDELDNSEIDAKLEEIEAADEPVEAPKGQAPVTENSDQPTDDSKKAETEDKTPEPDGEKQPEEKKEPEVEQEPVSKDEAPEPAPDKDKANQDKAVILTKEEFDQLPEDQQKKRAKLVGKTRDELIDMYENLESYVGKKKEDVMKELLTKQEPKEGKAETPESVEQAQKYREQIVLNKLHEKFSDLELPPTLDENSVEFKDWLSDLNSVDRPTARRFEKELDNITENVTKELDEIKNYRTNYTAYNNKTIQDSADEFGQYMQAELGLNLKDYGVDLSKKNADGELEFINAVLDDPKAAENNFLDPNIVKYGPEGTPIAGIPMIDKTQLLLKMNKMYGKDVFKKAIAKARAEAVVNKDQGKPDEFPSMSGSDVKGEQKKQLTIDDYKQITNNEKIDEELDKLEQA